ncbi:MAG: hypothetical protein HUJ63_02915 [Enterococcus sp.]|nr:hypothetical protein [Enterococcus sp.]
MKTMTKGRKEMIEIFTMCMIIAKVCVFVYMVGLCGAYENDALTALEFYKKFAVAAAFIVLG